MKHLIATPLGPIFHVCPRGPPLYQKHRFLQAYKYHGPIFPNLSFTFHCSREKNVKRRLAPLKCKSKSVCLIAAKRGSTCANINPETKKIKMGSSKAVGRSHNKSPLEKREKKMKKMKAKVKEMEAFVSDMRTQMEGERCLLLEGEAKVEEFKALVAQKEEENEMHFLMILWGELLADHIQFHFLP